MPIIEELSDSESEASPPPRPQQFSTEQQASAALEKCLRILRDESRPVQSRYQEILSLIAPLETYLSSTPSPSLKPFEERLLALLLPHPSFAPLEYYDDDSDDTSKSPSPALPIYHTLSLKLLQLLQSHPLNPSADLILALGSLTNPVDPFTTPNTASLATSILTSHKDAFSSPDIIITGILTDTIKPLFSQQTVSSTRITPAGRLAIRESSSNNADLIPEPAPWATALPGALAVLEWVLSIGLPDADMETAWPLLIPPILSTNDSYIIKLRARGIGMITQLLGRLENAKSDLLRRTGLGGVLWEAVERGLGYLPPLTPVKESRKVNKKATECLRLLARVREPRDMAKRAALMDRIVREGFEKGVVYAGEKVEIVEVLVDGLDKVVEDMGVWAVKHLQTVLPSLSEILANPFATTYVPLIRRTLRAEQTIIRNCWPRIAGHVPEILHGIVKCWSQILEDENVPGTSPTKLKELAELKTELKRVVVMLKAVVENSDDDAIKDRETGQYGGAARWTKIEDGLKELNQGLLGLFE